jgi:glyoxylase-like metal-dependent hydrolase (beta-lactamase superfamily II)
MEPALQETALSARLLVLTLGGDTPLTSYGANCLAFAGGNGTLLVDPLIAPVHARLVAEAVARRGFPPVTHVAVTHHHTDHALGAGWFAARGASVVAHRRCATEMAAQHPSLVAARRRAPELAALFADAEPHLPAVSFEERHLVDLGGVTAQVRHLGPGHTPGDAVVLFPVEDAVACGDLVFRGYHFNYEDADLEGLPRALRALAGLPASRFVPGHGPPGGREIALEQERRHAEAARLVAAAATPEEARAALRARWPGHLLEMAVETAVARLGAGRKWEGR